MFLVKFQLSKQGLRDLIIGEYDQNLKNAEAFLAEKNNGQLVFSN